MKRRLRQLAMTLTSVHVPDGWRREVGQTFVEYALLLAFVAAVALIAVQLLGEDVSSVFSQVAHKF